MAYPVVKKKCASWGVAALDVSDELDMWPLSVPMLTLGDEGSSLRGGESGA